MILLLDEDLANLLGEGELRELFAVRRQTPYEFMSEHAACTRVSDRLGSIPAVHAEPSPPRRRRTHVWPVIMLGQREAVQNFTDEQVSLRRGQALGDHVRVDTQAKHCPRVASGFSLNHDLAQHLSLGDEAFTLADTNYQTKCLSTRFRFLSIHLAFLALADAEIAAAADFVMERFGAAGSSLTAETVASLPRPR